MSVSAYGASVIGNDLVKMTYPKERFAVFVKDWPDSLQKGEFS